MDGLHKHIVVNSRSSALKEAETRLKSILDGLGLSDSEEHNILVAASEAINNAIAHGNKNDPHKHVSLDIDYSEKEIVVSVEDEGGGFDPESIPDPLAPENLLKPSGRGIHIMKSLMDRVDFTFTRRGTRITLLLKLKAAR